MIFVPPLSAPPPFGSPVEVAPGILLLRLPLPFRLSQVNVYVFEDDGGWTVLDTGVADAPTYAAWEAALDGVLSHRPVKRLICSHFHLDHVGLAGWLHERFSPEFCMSQTEYLLARVFQSDRSDESLDRQGRFFQAGGLGADIARKIMSLRMAGRDLQTPLPRTFERLSHGDALRIGGREWTVLTGAGHSVEQVMLYSKSDRLFLPADQVLPEISPNISVGHMLPNGDPLGDFLTSLGQIRSLVRDDALVLPGHRMPFYGLHRRINELVNHHASRCDAVMEACRAGPCTGVDLVKVIFQRDFELEVVGSAIGEALAHANYLCRQGLLHKDISPDGHYNFRAA